MEKAILVSAAYGWFAGLLTVMVIVTALFAFILVIALKPVKKDELDDSNSARRALGRRETELTIELLNKQNDAKRRAELESKLREVKAAEKLVEELIPEEEKPAPKKPAVKPPVKQSVPPKPVKSEQAKPAPAAKPVKEPKQPEEKKAEPKEEAKAEKQPEEKTEK